MIPKEIRRKARLASGMSLEVRWRAGRIEIEAAPTAVRLKRKGHLLVAVPKAKLPELTPKTVEQTRAKLLDERARGE